MKIKRSGSQLSVKSASEYFTGTVRVDPRFEAQVLGQIEGVRVTFDPGARTTWHSHLFGQTLIVTCGSGRVQHWGGPVEKIQPGDVVSIALGEKHWHGASPTTSLTHIAIQEYHHGNAADWMDKASDEQYQGK